MRIETQNAVARDSATQAQSGPAVLAPVIRLDPTARQSPAGTEQALPGNAALDSSGAETEQLNAAVRNINDYVQRLQRTLQFSVDDDTGTTVVKVLNAETDELIRQFPPEEALALARHLQSSQETQALDNSGLILRARA